MILKNKCVVIKWILAGFVPAIAWAEPDALLLSGFEAAALSEWRNPTRPELAPFQPVSTPELVKEGKGSARWSHLDRHKWIELSELPADWSGYGALSVWIHSEKPNGQKINLLVSAPREGEDQGYYLHQVEVDWTGWRQVVVPFSTFKKNRTPAPWSQIKGFRLTSAGWRAEPLTDSVLHLDELLLIRR